MLLAMLCGDDDCTVLTSPDCNPVRRHPRFQNLYTYIPIRNSEGAVKLNGRPAGCHLTCELRKGLLADPLAERPLRTVHCRGMSRFIMLGGFAMMHVMVAWRIFFFIHVNILFFLPFCMFSFIHYHWIISNAEKKRLIISIRDSIIIITLDICYSVVINI